MSFQGPSGGESPVGTEHLVAHIPNTPDDGKTEAQRMEHVRLVDEGPGDRGWLWHLAGHRVGDEFYYRAPTIFSRFSKMFSLPLIDGSWTQAMFGNLSFLIPLVGLIAGILATGQVHGEALPPELPLMATILVVAILNSFAGLLAFIPLLVGAILHGNVHTVHQLVTLFVVGAMWIPGPQISRRIRPLQRHLDKDGFDRLWHVVGDYVVQIVITAFIVGKFARIIPIVSGIEVPIASKEHALWIVAVIAVPVRQLLETATREWFPRRSAVVEAKALVHRNRWLTLFFEVGIQGSIVIGCLSTAIGFCWQLWVISGVYALMLIVEQSEADFPFITWIHRLVPVGVTRIVFVSVIGQFAARYFVEKGVHSSQDLTASIFIIVAIALFVITTLSKFPGNAWGRHPIWKALGASVIVFFVLLVTGTLSFA